MEARSIEFTNYLNLNLYNKEDREFFHTWVEIVASVLNIPIVGFNILLEGKQDLVAHRGFIKKRLFSSGDHFFKYTMNQDDCLVVRDALLDPRFRDSYFVENSPYIVSYLGMPLYNDKWGKIGTLFIADHEVREFSQDIINHFKIFTKQLQSILADKIDKESLMRKGDDQMRSLKHFIHDLKSPMSIVKLSLDMMTSRSKEEQVSPVLMNRCQNNLRKTLVTIDEFLKTDSFETRENLSSYERIDLQSFFRDTVNELHYFVGQDQQVFTKIETKEIYSDLKLVKRIIDNLISNAIKYGEGLDILIETKTIGDAIQISVTDQGLGIAEEESEKIFDFGHKNGAAALISHGIGLHFCKVSAEKLGGKLYFEKNYPRGSKFILELPIC